MTPVHSHTDDPVSGAPDGPITVVLPKKRTIENYNHKYALILSIVQIVCGILIFIFQIGAFRARSAARAAGMGIWCGILVRITILLNI